MSIRGTVYQAWCSIDAWLGLSGPDQVIYLEGVEDFDVTRQDDVLEVQVRHTQDPISLGTIKGLEALEHFWVSSHLDPRRTVSYQYHTTSPAAVEAERPFGSQSGIEVWRIAQTRPDLATKIADYLCQKLAETSRLRQFLKEASPEEICERLLKRFTWLIDQPGIDLIRRSVDDRLTAFLDARSRPLSLIEPIRNHLFAHFWEQVVRQPLEARFLSYGELLRQIAAASHFFLPIPVEQLITDVLDRQPGLAMLVTLRQPLPRAPQPLLRRMVLTGCVEGLLRNRSAVLLVGTVAKGKTTLAQQVAETICPDAWWFEVTSWTIAQLNTVFSALAIEIEQGRCPAAIVIDDLDTSEPAQKSYRSALSMVLYRAYAAGRAVLITSAGLSGDIPIRQIVAEVTVVEVPELSTFEIQSLCVENGCFAETASIWAAVIAASTGGHPKLVQIRIEELVESGWPAFTANDLTEPSPGAATAQEIARQILRSTVSDEVAEFLYTTSMASISLRRPSLIALAESAGIKNAGDVIDQMSGRWLERTGKVWYRTTALLKGSSGKVWSSSKVREAHSRIHDAILENDPMTTSEGAALLFHAYGGQDHQRLMRTAMELLTLEGEEEQREVHRELLWLPYLALKPGDRLAETPSACVWLRMLQFRAAATLASDLLGAISDRWAEDIERVEAELLRKQQRILRWSMIAVTLNSKLPLRFRLEAAFELQFRTSGDSAEIEIIGRAVEAARAQLIYPPNTTIGQFVLSGTAPLMRTAGALEELLEWLEKVATDELRQQFDELIEWPLIQGCGAFIHGVWTADAKADTDWSNFFSLLDRVDEYAKRRGSVRYGREAAKARAVILSEYRSQHDEAVVVLKAAEQHFGASAVLMEQRATLHFHAKQYASVLEVWKRLENALDFAVIRNTYSYRRAALSAARLEQWRESERYLTAARAAQMPDFSQLTDTSLAIDIALAATRAGHHIVAATTLCEAILKLPSEAGIEGNPKWEMVLRAAATVSVEIDSRVFGDGTKVFVGVPGDVSTPDYAMPAATPNQALRTQMTCGQVFALACTLGVDRPEIQSRAMELATSKFAQVRILASKAKLSAALNHPAAGGDLIGAVLLFDHSLRELAGMASSHQGLEPDGGPNAVESEEPERWLAFIVVASICTNIDFVRCATAWEAEARLLKKVNLANSIACLLSGAQIPHNDLYEAVCNAELNPLTRCGAAIRMLVNLPEPDMMFRLQMSLANALASMGIAPIQDIFNRHVANVFRGMWRVQSRNAFQFRTPRTTIPTLLEALEETPARVLSIAGVLRAAGEAVGSSFVGDIHGIT